MQRRNAKNETFFFYKSYGDRGRRDVGRSGHHAVRTAHHRMGCIVFFFFFGRMHGVRRVWRIYVEHCVDRLFQHPRAAGGRIPLRQVVRYADIHRYYCGTVLYCMYIMPPFVIRYYNAKCVLYACDHGNIVIFRGRRRRRRRLDVAPVAGLTGRGRRQVAGYNIIYYIARAILVRHGRRARALRTHVRTRGELYTRVYR